MTKRGFKIALAVAASLGVAALIPTFLFCTSIPKVDQCLSATPFISWAGGIAVFLFATFVFFPLVATFIGVPFMLSMVPQNMKRPGSICTSGSNSFFIIREWAKYE